MKVWYITVSLGTAEDGSDTTETIKTDITEKDAVIDKMLEMLKEDPRRAMIAGLAEDQDGIPKEYEDITQLIM